MPKNREIRRVDFSNNFDPFWLFWPKNTRTRFFPRNPTPSLDRTLSRCKKAENFSNLFRRNTVNKPANGQMDKCTKGIS